MVGPKTLAALEKRKSDSSGSSVCDRHKFLSHRRECPYCKIEAGFYLAIGSRGTARDAADQIREHHQWAAEVLDRLSENFDRLAGIIKAFEETENQS